MPTLRGGGSAGKLSLFVETKPASYSYGVGSPPGGTNRIDRRTACRGEVTGVPRNDTAPLFTISSRPRKC